MKVSSLEPDYTFYTLTHSRSSKASLSSVLPKKRKLILPFVPLAIEVPEPELIITITTTREDTTTTTIVTFRRKLSNILCPTKKHMPEITADFKSTIIDEDHQFQAWLKLKRYVLNDLPLLELFLLCSILLSLAKTHFWTKSNFQFWSLSKRYHNRMAIMRIHF